MDENEKLTIPVIEEQLTVDKEMMTTGSLHVRKRVEEVATPVEATLTSESYTIERIPKDQIVEKAPEPMRNEGDRIIISVVEERLVVEKRLVLVEEIHMIKKQESRDYREEVTLRKEVVEVERKTASE
ncbi:MAG TPA: YsnF/AvaK domain-containing protein [Chryseosolibacter sp.]